LATPSIVDHPAAGPELLHRPILTALVMATNMTIGMSLWMRFRRRGWTRIAEACAAMYMPFVILFLPDWAGLISGHMVMLGGPALMLPAMVAVMLLRPDEYTRRPSIRNCARPTRCADRAKVSTA
jgi:hypothetical protein